MRSTLCQPLRFEPFLRPTLWGGRRLGGFLGKNLCSTVPYGESWEVSDHPLHASKLTTASGYGVSLRQLMAENRRELLGAAADLHGVFPWLIKILDANDWLSVQVHPDDEAARRLCPGELGKTEAWYILEAAPTAKIYAGLKPGIGANQLMHALHAGTVVDCLHAFTPKVGDFIYLPAGTVHAVGGGVLFVEIQQTSDATFRLFDWQRVDAHGKARALHIDQAFGSIHWAQGAVQPVAANSADRQALVVCPYFQIERARWKQTTTLGGHGRLQALIVTQGQGRFANGEFVTAGDVWILPSAMSKITLTPDASITGLLCSLPV